MLRVFHDIHVDLYAQADPPADFDELVRNAKVDEDGRKHIDYDSYYLPIEKYDEIINKHINEARPKLKEWEKRALRQHVYLGCGPTSCPRNSGDGLTETRKEAAI